MIKFRNISRRFVAGVMALTMVSAVGCSKQKDNTSKDNYTSKTIASNYYNDQHVTIKNKSQVSKVSETAEPEMVESSIDSSMYDVVSSQEVSEESKKKFSTKDVISFLEDLDEKITDKSENIAQGVADGCKMAYNFVFNDGAIKGYTLNELEDSMQQKAITIIAKIDKKIDKHLPNYKENIKTTFGNTKDKIVNLAKKFGEKFKNKIIDIIGEEKFESYVEIKDELVSIGNEQLHDDIDTLKDALGYLKNKAKSLVKKKN